MPTIKVDDDEQELLTFDDWMLLTGQNNTAEPTTRGKRGKRNESGDDLLTPRSRENKLKATLRSLGLSDRLTSWELQRLEQELLDHTYEHPADLDRESTDSGPKSRSTMGAAGNTSGYRTTISRERARPAGQLRVALLAARQIPTTKGTVLHAYAVARTGRHRFESPVDRTSDGPDGRFEWTTNFVPVPVAPATMRTIEFSVWNSEVTGDDVLMGSVTAVLEDIMPVQQLSAGREAATVVQWMRLKPPPGQLSTSGRGAGELQMRLSFIPRPMDDLDHQLNIELAAAERARASLIAAAKAAEEIRSMSALVQRMLEAETLDHAGASLPVRTTYHFISHFISVRTSYHFISLYRTPLFRTFVSSIAVGGASGRQRGIRRRRFPRRGWESSSGAVKTRMRPRPKSDLRSRRHCRRRVCSRQSARQSPLPISKTQNSVPRWHRWILLLTGSASRHLHSGQPLSCSCRATSGLYSTLAG